VIRLRSLRRDQRGMGAIEFALIAPVLTMLILGTVQLGMVFMAHTSLRHAVAEGVRTATLYPRPSTATIKASMAGQRFGLQPANLSEPSVVYGKQGQSDFATIGLTYSVPLTFVFVKTAPLTLSYERRVWLQPEYGP
jgi:Flp pilus assembly protein TadG